MLRALISTVVVSVPQEKLCKGGNCKTLLCANLNFTVDSITVDYQGGQDYYTT